MVFFSFFLFYILGERRGMGVCVCVMGEFELLLLLSLLEMSAGIATWEAGEEAVRLSIVGSYRHHINFSPGGSHLTAYIDYMYAQHCRRSTWKITD